MMQVLNVLKLLFPDGVIPFCFLRARKSYCNIFYGIIKIHGLQVQYVPAMHVYWHNMYYDKGSL